MRKAEWDKFPSWDAFRDWYRPHLEQVSRILAPSANLYVWGTDDSASALRELVGSMGWTRKRRVTWDKGIGCMAGKVDTNALRGFYDVTEVCDHYQRDEWTLQGGAGATIAHAANADARNPAPVFFAAERERAGMTRRDLASHFPSASGRVTGCVSNWEGGQNFPTWAVWRRAAWAAGLLRPPAGLLRPPAGRVRPPAGRVRSRTRVLPAPRGLRQRVEPPHRGGR